MSKITRYGITRRITNIVVVLTLLTAACSLTPQKTGGGGAGEKKGNKWDTRVEIWVAPFSGNSASGLMK